MSEQPPDEQRPRARAVADAPLESVLGQSEQLARRWAVAMISTRALSRAAEMPLAELALHAPELCEQILRALTSQQQLDRLLGKDGGSSRGPAQDFPAALLACSGAHEPVEVTLAVEQLRGVLWEELHTHCGRDARLALDLGDRLAHVCATLLAVALAGISAAASATTSDSPPAVEHSGHSARIVIFDERAPRGEEDEPAPQTRREGDEISIRDVRHTDHGPAAWIDSIGAQLQRHEHDGERFAVLLLELTAQGQRSAELLEPALQAAVAKSEDVLFTQEREGRCWLILPHADRAAAHTLAARIEQTIHDAASRQGLTMSVATGTAVCPEDGSSASALAAHADVGLYASRWAARAAAGPQDVA